ncbi:Hypothetical protein CAP_2731 [Chondromyces apiculatus DSM 436]|uniref:Uncharacterized protein n=1 Tax=Chondromyces apiculatus DSM 436 TaxID=1192034 RepID=A0A017TJ50_9BACT|nr:Hypothetical protein CAP_2731 [Chondromyces apiculatus DSM 436]
MRTHARPAATPDRAPPCIDTIGPASTPTLRRDHRAVHVRNTRSDPYPVRVDNLCKSW